MKMTMKIAIKSHLKLSTMVSIDRVYMASYCGVSCTVQTSETDNVGLAYLFITRLPVTRLRQLK